jgi:hypothetical protein
MTRSILLAGAALISVSISPLNAEASEALWCAVISRSDGDVHWDCTYRSIEECRPNVIADNGKRGFCSPSPYYVANRTELKNSRQAARTGSKTIAKSEKSIAVKKESPRHRNANAHTKIAESTITTKIETPQPSQPDGKSNAELRNSITTKIETPQPSQSDGSNGELKNSIATKIETPQPSQPDGKSNAELKNSIATKIEIPQPSQPDGKSNAELKNSIATKIEIPQPSQSDGKSNAESKNSIATKIETPQPSQSDDKSNAEANMKSIAAKTETSQSSQFDDESVIKKARVTIAAKMDNPASVVFLDMKRAAREDALGNSIDTICGRVRGKLAGDTGDRPFLYVVQKDEAYIGAYTIATTEYRKICN